MGTGSVFLGTSGTAGEADGTGTAATFNNPGPIVMSGGNMFIASNGAGLKLRKVTPAGLTSAHATPGAAVTSMVAAADGTIYAAIATPKIVKISPDGATVSDFVGDGTVSAAAAGVGTSAKLGAENYIALSKDEKTMYILSNTDSSVALSTGVSFLTVNMENQATAVVTGKPATDGASADGVGSNAILSAVMGATVDSAGNVVFTERGATGGTVRKYEPATQTFSTVSSTAILAGTASNVAAAAAPTATLNNGAAETAKFVFPTAIIPATSFCGKLAPEGTPVEITSECSELKGDVSSVSVTGADITVSEPLNVAGDASVNPGAKLTATAATAIAGALGLTGNGTFTVGGAAVTAGSFAMAADSTYRILVEAATPAKLAVTNAADLAGTVVVLVGKDFDEQFLVKLRTPFSRRALLQAPNVNVACGNT